MSPTRVLIAVLALALAATQAQAQLCRLGETERRIVTCRKEVSMAECRAQAQKMGCSVARILPLVHAVAIDVPKGRVAIAAAAAATGTAAGTRAA